MINRRCCAADFGKRTREMRFRCILLLIGVSWCVCEHVSRVAHNDAQRTTSCRRKISEISKTVVTRIHMSFLIRRRYALNDLASRVQRYFSKLWIYNKISNYRRRSCVTDYFCIINKTVVIIFILMRSDTVIEPITTYWCLSECPRAKKISFQ